MSTKPNVLVNGQIQKRGHFYFGCIHEIFKIDLNSNKARLVSKRYKIADFASVICQFTISITPSWWISIEFLCFFETRPSLKIFWKYFKNKNCKVYPYDRQYSYNKENSKKKMCLLRLGPWILGYIDVGDRCWRQNVLVTTIRCLWQFWPFWSPTSTIFLH